MNANNSMGEIGPNLAVGCGYLDDLRRARHEVSQLSRRCLGESTSTRYRQVYCRVLKKGSVDLGNRSYTKLVRAAFAHTLEKNLLDAEVEATMVQAYRELVQFREAISRYPGRCGLARFLELRGIAVSGAGLGEGRARVPRTRRLRSLPADWREKMLEALSTEIPRAREALIVLALTGCRPEELKTASVHIESDGSIRVTVISVKELDGVMRGADFIAGGPAGQIAHLAMHADEAGGLLLEDFSAKRVDNLLRRTSVRAFPQLVPGICASCYRNQAASDLKLSGASPREIALFLGHTTTRQQKTYGRSTRGHRNSKWSPVRILESHQVREMPVSYPASGNDECWEEQEEMALVDLFGADSYDGDSEG